MDRKSGISLHRRTVFIAEHMTINTLDLDSCNYAIIFTCSWLVSNTHSVNTTNWLHHCQRLKKKVVTEVNDAEILLKKKIHHLSKVN